MKMNLWSTGLGCIVAATMAIGCGSADQPKPQRGPNESQANVKGAQPPAHVTPTGKGKGGTIKPNVVVQCGTSTNSGQGGYNSSVTGFSYTSAEEACAVCKADLLTQDRATYGAMSCGGCSGMSTCTGKFNQVLVGGGDCQVFAEPDDHSSLTHVTCSGTVASSYTCTPTGNCDNQCCAQVNPNNVCNTTNQCVTAGCMCNGMGENHDRNGCVADGNSCTQLGGILNGCGAGSGCP